MMLFPQVCLQLALGPLFSIWVSVFENTTRCTCVQPFFIRSVTAWTPEIGNDTRFVCFFVLFRQGEELVIEENLTVLLLKPEWSFQFWNEHIDRDPGDSEDRRVWRCSVTSCGTVYPAWLSLEGPLHMLAWKSWLTKPTRRTNRELYSFCAITRAWSPCHDGKRFGGVGGAFLNLSSCPVSSVVSFLVAFGNDLLELQNLFLF